MKRVIFHVDVNNAFLSWTAVTMLKNGSKVDIRCIPAVVGGDESKRRGIVLAKSNPAKKAGIVTGEPLYMARRKVDKLLIVEGAGECYSKYSNAFYKILCDYSPSVERYSIDECFLDMTGTEKMFGKPETVAYEIKNRIKKELGFTVNVGIGNSKLCAKMASDFEKPDKVHTLYNEEVKDKMWPLSVDDLFMVGKRSSAKLHEMGINTIGELALADVNMLIRHFKQMGNMMHNYANGIDDSPIERPIPKNQGIGHSTTLPTDLDNISDIRKVLFKLSSMVGLRLREEEKYAQVVAIQLKNNEFYSYGHQKKLINPISSDEDIYEVSCELLKDAWKGDPIRLVGLRVTNFTDKTYEQISLFGDTNRKENRDKIQKALDEINKKYGSNTINRASLFNKEEW